MKVNDCKEIRRQIEETDLGQELDVVATGHMRQCSSCQELFDSGNKLRQLIASLPSVETPADFEFRLRARISNELYPLRRRLPIGNWSFVPSVALAALALTVGAIFILRTDPASQAPSGNIAEKAKTNPAETVSGVTHPTANDKANNPQSKITTDAKSVLGIRSANVPLRRELAIVGTRRLVTKDSSIVGATVVKREDSVARAQLPLVFPVQTLTVSLDDGSGVSRTISFPTVSFGSERVLTRSGSSFQAPAKGDW